MQTRTKGLGSGQVVKFLATAVAHYAGENAFGYLLGQCGKNRSLLRRQRCGHDAFMSKAIDPRPGDLFVDRYMPGASAEEREDAYQNVRHLIAVLVRINERLRRKGDSDDSRESEGCGRVEGSAPAQTV